MENFISCCGLDCSKCEAYIATKNNDDKLRKETAEKWMKLYNSPEIKPESINCLGCRQDGVKLGHCAECKIRICVYEKGYETCGNCSEMEKCELVAQVHKHVPEAILNLKSLN